MNETKYTAAMIRGRASTLNSVAAWMENHPHLTMAELIGGDPRVGSVAELLAWAKAFGADTVGLYPDGTSVHVVVAAPDSGFAVDTYDTGDLYRLTTEKRVVGRVSTRITVDQLAAYVAAGNAGELLEVAPR